MKKNNNVKPVIKFNITKKCNYNCEYCELNKDENETGHASDKVINAFLNFIKSQREKWEIQLSGGEPLVHSEFYEILKKIIDDGHNVSIITNFSFPLENYLKIADICQEQFKGLASSLHLSQVKDLDKFINKAVEFNKYKKQKTSFRIASVITEENFKQIKYVYKRLQLNGINFRAQHLKIDKKYFNYPKEIKDFIMNVNVKNDPLNKIKDINTYGTLCYAGYKLFNIDWYGNVYRCYNNDNKLHQLGNLESGTFKPFNKPMPCLSARCTCIQPVNHNMIRFGETDPEMLKQIESKQSKSF